jgi:hypothetical protein
MVATVSKFVERIEVDESLTSDGLSAKLEPFDSFWQAPDDLESGYNKFDAYYKANFFGKSPTASDEAVAVYLLYQVSFPYRPP